MLYASQQSLRCRYFERANHFCWSSPFKSPKMLHWIKESCLFCLSCITFFLDSKQYQFFMPSTSWFYGSNQLYCFKNIEPTLHFPLTSASSLGNLSSIFVSWPLLNWSIQHGSTPNIHTHVVLCWYVYTIQNRVWAS